VVVGARIASLAGPDEVLASRTVRDLLLGSDIRFADRGEHHRKGLPNTWHAFAVINEPPDRPTVNAPVHTPESGRPAAMLQQHDPRPSG
jgi:class 3 adenylate cyclase